MASNAFLRFSLLTFGALSTFNSASHASPMYSLTIIPLPAGYRDETFRATAINSHGQVALSGAVNPF